MQQPKQQGKKRRTGTWKYPSLRIHSLKHSFSILLLAPTVAPEMFQLKTNRILTMSCVRDDSAHLPPELKSALKNIQIPSLKTFHYASTKPSKDSHEAREDVLEAVGSLETVILGSGTCTAGPRSESLYQNAKSLRELQIFTVENLQFYLQKALEQLLARCENPLHRRIGRSGTIQGINATPLFGHIGQPIVVSSKYND